jgi:two-component system, sensor histidine kinase
MPPTNASESGPQDPHDEEGEDILVVDDDPANLLAIEVALGDLGRRLVKVQSGTAALRRLLTQRFALVLLDVQMPSMNGFETARLIRGRPSTKHLPIIFVTAFRADSKEVLEGYALGAVDFLFKPIVPEILRAKASVFVEMRRHVVALARQAAMLRQHEEREHERRVDIERQRWEAEALRRNMEKERRDAIELSRKADELARTVAERQRAEAELTRINGRLAEADRRKDEFLAMLAHELRNPLAPIINGLALFRQQRLEEPSLQRARAAMERQVGHLQRLVDDLLDVARITSGQIDLRVEPLELGSVIEQAVAMSRPHIDERHHRLDVTPADVPIAVYGDAVRLTQVVANLLNNAARYTDDHGRLGVAWALEGSEAVISVTDNGRGIANDRIESIFKTFVRDANGGGGLGLGLTLVERIVALHEGVVQVHSDGPGRGSRFVVRLPNATMAEVVAPIEKTCEPGNDGLDIVLIEDNEDIRETVQMLLEHWGHRVATADDGAMGIDLVLARRPDVALVDIGLPLVDGYAVAERVRAELGDGAPRMIAMTGFGRRNDRRRAIRAGFDAHVVKPVEPERLRRLLAEHPSLETRNADVSDSHLV